MGGSGEPLGSGHAPARGGVAIRDGPPSGPTRQLTSQAVEGPGIVVSAHFGSALPKNALTWAFVTLIATLGLLLAPSAAQAAPPPAPANGAPLSGSAAKQSLARTGAAAPLAPGALLRLRGARVVVAAAPLAPGALLRPRGARVVVAAAPLSPGALLRLRGARIVAAAGAQRGKPYRRGAQGPGAFDCSGLSGYAYRAVHIRLPRTANEQYHAAHPVGRAAARPGDLVFWVSGRHAYHVAVYAGAGRVWHAPKPGDRVRLAKIWSPGAVRFGRVGA